MNAVACPQFPGRWILFMPVLKVAFSPAFRCVLLSRTTCPDHSQPLAGLGTLLGASLVPGSPCYMLTPLCAASGPVCPAKRGSPKAGCAVAALYTAGSCGAHLPSSQMFAGCPVCTGTELNPGDAQGDRHALPCEGHRLRENGHWLHAPMSSGKSNKGSKGGHTWGIRAWSGRSGLLGRSGMASLRK